MKIEKWVTVEKEVTIDICWEDIEAILAESAKANALDAVQAAYATLRAVDPSSLTDDHRSVVATALRAQADRFYSLEKGNTP